MAVRVLMFFHNGQLSFNGEDLRGRVPPKLLEDCGLLRRRSPVHHRFAASS